MLYYYRHSIILNIGFRCSTQASNFTAPFVPHMTLLGFMCPGLGNFIRSQVLSHCAINKPHDTSPLSHSPSPDQLPLLHTPLVFTTYHTLYGTCTATSTPTIAFVLISPIHTDKKGTNRIHPTLCISLCAFASHLHLHFTPCSHFTLCLHLHLPPPLLSYLFTHLALLSGCIQLDSTLFHSFSPIITNTPITLHTPACLLMFMLVLCLHSLALCAHA